MCSSSSGGRCPSSPRPDPTSPTGLRLNGSIVASTHLERVARERLNEANSPTHVLDVVTVGDAHVPVSTGIALAKVAGSIELQAPDSRYGKTANRVLIDEGVQHGIPWLESRGPGHAARHRPLLRLAR